MKIRESELKKIIKETLSEFKDTYKTDADRRYVRPNGKDYISSHDMPERRNYDDKDYRFHLNGKNYDPIKREIPNTNLFSKGKGDLCFQVNRKIEEIFGLDAFDKPIGKVKWTKNELDMIAKIKSDVRKLADMSKTEAAKARHGVTDDKLAAMIRESIRKALS